MMVPSAPRLLLAMTTLTGALAAVVPAIEKRAVAPFCLTDHDANIVANNFGQSLSNFSIPLAQAVFASDFTDQSDSANTLIDGGTQSPLPLGQLTFPNKATLIKMQGSQPNIPFQILNVYHSCDTVTVRWVSKMSPQQVQGIDVLTVEPSTAVSPQYGAYQIKTTYGEFNTGAWLQDIGCTVTCPPPP